MKTLAEEKVKESPTTEVRVRRATILDLKELLELLEAHCLEWDAEGFPFDEAERMRFAAYVVGLLASPTAWILAAMDGKTMVGCGVMELQSRPVGLPRLWMLGEAWYVRPSSRGQQVGRQLYGAGYQVAHAAGAEQFVVRVKPERQAVWERQGYQVATVELRKAIAPERTPDG